MRNALSLTGKKTLPFHYAKAWLSSLVIFFFFGCQNISHPERPKDLISEDKMVEVLIDIHLFNAAKAVNRLTLQQTGMTPHEFIYEKHDIDSAQYERSNAYYGVNLDTYERIHTRVRAFLEQEKTRIDTLIVRERRKQDTVNMGMDTINLLQKELKNKPAAFDTITDSIN